MAVQNGVYKCSICGNVVEVLFDGGAELVCCGKPMVLQSENTVEASKEKHVPVISKTGQIITVTVGSIPHPMEEKHYIMWIELWADGKVCRQFLKPTQRPEAKFNVDAQKITARAFCNLHGLWKSL